MEDNAWRILLVVGALLACRTESSAPEANPDLAAAPGSGSASAPSRAARTPTSLNDRKLIGGFEKLTFGEEYKAVKKSAKLRKRCGKRPLSAALDKKFPSQSFEERFVFCDATIADRYAKLTLYFDHEDRLYRVTFSFSNKFDSKVRELNGTEVNKFVADLRAVLEPKHGKPIDISTDGITGKEIALQWLGKTADSPPHETEINVRLDQDIVTTQIVEWIDKTREAATDARIEKERTQSIKSKGL